MTQETLIFLLSAVAISLSGVMAPGPMTAVTVESGSRHRHAGLLLAVGHGIVEFPLMVLIMLGMGRLFQFSGVKMGIGLVGGAMLLWMGLSMLRDSRKPVNLAAPPKKHAPVLAGILLTAGNPYFLLWWATVGLTLATQAAALGVLAFAFFSVLHWLCDMIWLEALSLASFKGSRLLGPKGQKWVLCVCGIAMGFFGLKFLWDSLANLWA